MKLELWGYSKGTFVVEREREFLKKRTETNSDKGDL